jgi:polyferredoxin
VAFTGLIFPYFFCNASPGAVCVCPLWVLEHASILVQLDFREALAMFLYLFGFLGLVGFFVGRSFCGWACPIGFIQDIAKYFRGKIKFRLNTIFGIFIFGWLLFGSIFIYPHVVTGYLGITGTSIIALSLFGLLLKLNKIFISASVAFLSVVSLIIIRVSIWDQVGTREIFAYLALELLFVGILGIIVNYYGQRAINSKQAKFYHQSHYFKLKYLILILIPITSFVFMDKWFTNIDPIGGLTAGVPVLMYEGGQWNVSYLLWIKFILIALFFLLILISYRSFCTILCPVGALMAPTNKISIQEIKFYEENCTKCNKCIKSCPMRINIFKMKRDLECIRCGRCVDACKDNAMHMVIANKIVR